jgi:transcriptional regulator with XRE-family HTH domain
MKPPSVPKNKRSSNVRDQYIARKLRERRIEMGLHQSDVANNLGITHQQVYKYEQGIDRIPASRLYEFAKILSAPVSFFYGEEKAESRRSKEKELVVTCANLQGRRVKLKFFKLKATLTDTKTQEDYDVEIS